MGYQLIGACSGWGAQIRGCEKGPEDLHLEGIKLLYPLKKAKDEEISFAQALPLIQEFIKRLAQEVGKAKFPVVIEGDHSSAIGTWSGVYSAHKKPIGLIWIDAHMDSHTEETTPSGAWHGMPLAALLGYGILAHKVLQPEHVALVGVRSFEKEEKALLDKLKIKVYYMEEVKQRGLAVVLKEAVERVSQGTCGFGVSLDVDVLDPEDAPGVGSPETGGIRANELLPALHVLKTAKLIGVEVAEYNPDRDLDHKTKKLVLQILKGLLP